jgi:serine/threonine protein kinase
MSVSISREKTVFYAALDVADPAQRRQFLDQACASDVELRAAVEELLAVHADSEQFFDDCASSVMTLPADELESAAALTAELCGPVFEEKPGTIIGHYKLLQKIGEGGCGLVYLAEQAKPVRRQVALKVIKLGMDTKNVIARFEAERQALAMMDHPNIARVLDAGATDAGRPYFVMEMVNGVRITEYCDQNRLGLEPRLKLFIQVCHAIQHAHQKGIIHRDIKPSNVLVTMLDGVPVPKVIDFGIAKATDERLTDKTLFTAYAQLIGTPAYMSPEQMELGGLDLDTRSDIYSLGVLLYELLTGRTPFDSKELLKSGVEEMRHTLLKREPVCPSAKLRTLDGEELSKTAGQRHIEVSKLLSELRGDLDWIIMKALEKDRARRYETANGLAMDIQRHLNHEPVTARPPGNWYRLQRLVRRNRVIFLAGSAVVAALLIGTVTSTWLFFKERDARAKEAKLRQEAEQHAQVALLVTQQKFVEADKVLLHQIDMGKPSIEESAELRALGDWHAVSGRWPQAADRFALAAQMDQLDEPEVLAEDQLKLASTLVEAGNLRGYGQFRQTAIARFTAASHPAADWTIKVALLLPAEQRMLEALKSQGELVKNTFQPEGVPTANPAQEARRAETTALLEYRRGNYGTAAGWCQRCLAYPVYDPPMTAGAREIWAMSCWHLGDKWQALAQWSLGQELVAAKFDQGLDQGNALEGFWFDWIIARQLMRECDQQFVEADRSFVPTSEFQPGTNDLTMARMLGDWHALHQDWRGAEEHFRTLLKMNRFDWWGNVTVDYQDYDVTAVELGDTTDYERSREQAVERFKGTDNKWIADRVLNSSLILPANSNLLAALEPMAKLAANPPTNSDSYAWEAYVSYPAWSSMSVALFEYRRGQYVKAGEWSGRCLAYPDCLPLPGTTARIILAMSLQQLGKHETARSELGLAQTSIQNGFKATLNQYNWRDWLFARILLREALQLQGGVPKTNR